MQDYIPREKDINEQIEPVTVKQFDNNSRFLHVKILDKDVDNELFDLSDCTASLYIQPKGNEDPANVAYVTGEASFDEEEGGVATFLLPGSVTQNPGEYECEIHINEGNTENYPHISTKPFIMTVEKSIRNDQAIMASAQFSALDRWASDVQNINARMNALEAMADSGEIPAGTVEAEVAASRVGWDGTMGYNSEAGTFQFGSTEYSSLAAALAGQVGKLRDMGLIYLGTFLNSQTWSTVTLDGSNTFAGLPTNIFAVCNTVEAVNPISDAPVSGPMNGYIFTFGRADKDYRRNFDTQIFMQKDRAKIWARVYEGSVWSGWEVIGGDFINDFPQFRSGVNDSYTEKNYLISNVTDDGTFFVSQTATVGGSTVTRWTDLPTDNQNFIVTNTGYSANWILQTAIPTDALGTVYNRLIPRPTISESPCDWVKVSDIDTRLKVLAVGDSICRGWRNGGKGFVGDLGLPYENEGVSGATLSTDRADVTNIPTQLANYKSNYPNYKPDIIIANGGHNDYDRNVLLGDIPTRPATSVSALNMSTVMGGLQKLFLTMIQEYPTAERFFVTTHKIKKNGVYLVTENNTAGYNEADLHDAIVACCNVYNVKIIDVFNDSPINSFFPEYVSNINYTYNPTPTDSTGWAEAVANTTDYINADGVHPLSRGYLEGYVPLILAALKGNTSGAISRAYLSQNEITEVLTG